MIVPIWDSPGIPAINKMTVPLLSCSKEQFIGKLSDEKEPFL